MSEQKWSGSIIRLTMQIQRTAKSAAADLRRWATKFKKEDVCKIKS
jgi:hypothetical protein